MLDVSADTDVKYGNMGSSLAACVYEFLFKRGITCFSESRMKGGGELYLFSDFL